MIRTTEQGLADGRACLAAALAYLERGWSVIPLCPPDHCGVGREHGKTCKTPGKRPLVHWEAYQQRLATADEVRDWWIRWANANVGVVMGAVSGLVGLDVDGPGGAEIIRQARLATVVGHPLEFRTPGGGRRLLYTAPADEIVDIIGEVVPGRHNSVLLLAEGSQTVMPPSRHQSGGLYAWVGGVSHERNGQ